MDPTEEEPFIPFDPDAQVIHARRKLPHWEQPGCTYFVTFRLADSIPSAKLEEWKDERDAWLKSHPEPWTSEVFHQYQNRFLNRIERWSDQGWGSCIMRDPATRQIVENAFLYFDDDRNRMDHFVIMPNHAHILFQPSGGWSLDKILHSWKSFTAHEINKSLNRLGSLWMDERFDHIVRSEEQLSHFQKYILNNPTRAGLGPSEYTTYIGRPLSYSASR